MVIRGTERNSDPGSDYYYCDDACLTYAARIFRGPLIAALITDDLRPVRR